jgi:hypothetical protein
MRKFGLLVLVVLLAGLASCAETAGPNYAYAPSYGYEPGYAYAPGYGYGAWLYAYGAWPQGYFCCGPRLVGIGHFGHFGPGHFGHGHFGHGGHHH